MKPERPLPLQPGDVVAQRYRVERVLGIGGMGAVFAARDTLGRLVAIKVLLAEVASDPEVLARFAREARATERIQDPHVTRVIDAGALPNGVPFLVMEYLEGSDLRSFLRRHGPFSGAEAARVGVQVCSALGEAHALGIIHRDLKLGNLFVVEPVSQLFVKVLDFGVAKFLSSSVSGDQHEMTQSNAHLGSRLYMSPEQMLRPKDVDARTDIWSLGVILYFVLAGRAPFEGQTPEEMILRIMYEEPPALSGLRPDLAEALVAIVHRCLAKDREQRFASMTELGQALQSFVSLAGMKQTLRLTPAHPQMATGVSDAPTAATWHTPAKPSARRRSWIYAAPFVAIGALAAVVVIKRSGAEPPKHAKARIAAAVAALSQAPQPKVEPAEPVAAVATSEPSADPAPTDIAATSAAPSAKAHAPPRPSTSAVKQRRVLPPW